MTKLEEKITDLIKEPIEDLGYILKRVEVGREGKKKTVTVVISKEEGYIGINDCVLVSRTIEPILDSANLIEESWVLIVSSPGEDA